MSIMRKKGRPFRGGSAFMEERALTSEMAGERQDPGYCWWSWECHSCVDGLSVDL